MWHDNMCSRELLQSMTGCYNMCSSAGRPDLLQAGRSGVQIPELARHYIFSKAVQSGSGAHPAFISMGTGVLSLKKSGGAMKLTTHFYLVPRIQMKGAIPLLPLYALIARAEATVLLYNSCLFDQSI